jgi:nitrogenase molybdenum-cofactor synthesis protein NifE
MSTAVLEKRRKQVATVEDGKAAIDCAKPSLAGSVSQRACVFCGSRVVLYPIVDAVHLVHGPAGCAAYTWDIRGTVSSGPELHRLCFTTDLREKDVIFGGAEKLERALRELIVRYMPKAAFVYATCIVGVIGDDVEKVCRKMSAEVGIPVVPVRSEGFRGTKKDGYAAACDALAQLIGTLEPTEPVPPYSINILGDFNLAGELWILEEYYRRMGVNILARITGDGRVDDIRRAHHAKLNVVQCSGSMTYLAKHMKEAYGVPFKQVSYFGIEDMSAALYDVAAFFGDSALHARAAELVREEVSKILPMIESYRAKLTGRKAVIYVGGAFKTISLIKALRLLGVETVVAGSQTGRPEDYATMAGLCDPGTIIVDDSNPVELSTFARERGADLFIGGVKERPIAYKMGMAFCDHNHERKLPLAGYEGMKNFAEEVYGSVMTPVWNYVRRDRKGGAR